MFLFFSKALRIYGEISLIYGGYKDRWFVVNKPAGWSLVKSVGTPSIENALQGFCEKQLFFPLLLEKSSQGLLPIATDSHMCTVIKRLFKLNIAKTRYRVLADISKKTQNSSIFAKKNFEFPSFTPKRKLLGSLLNKSKNEILSRGYLQSCIQRKFLKLRLSHNNDEVNNFEETNHGYTAEDILSAIAFTDEHFSRSTEKKETNKNFVECLEEKHFQSISSKMIRRFFGGYYVFPNLLNLLQPSPDLESVEFASSHNSKVFTTKFSLLKKSANQKLGLFEVQISNQNCALQIYIHFLEGGCPVLGTDEGFNLMRKKKLFFEDCVSEKKEEAANSDAANGGVPTNPFFFAEAESSEGGFVEDDREFEEVQKARQQNRNQKTKKSFEDASEDESGAKIDEDYDGIFTSKKINSACVDNHERERSSQRDDENVSYFKCFDVHFAENQYEENEDNLEGEESAREEPNNAKSRDTARNRKDLTINSNSAFDFCARKEDTQNSHELEHFVNKYSLHDTNLCIQLYKIEIPNPLGSTFEKNQQKIIRIELDMPPSWKRAIS